MNYYCYFWAGVAFYRYALALHAFRPVDAGFFLAFAAAFLSLGVHVRRLT